MKRVLHIQGSPRDDGNSASYAKMFIKAYQAKNPKHYVETLNVWTDTFQFSQGHVSAKYDVLSGMVPGSVWNKVTEAITHFKSFDKYIVSCGMWNFSIPHMLKNYIDILVQPGLTFKYEDGEHVPLVNGKEILFIVSRSGVYEENSPSDFQLSYLNHIFGFMGLKNATAFAIEGLALPDRMQRLDKCTYDILRLARTW